jgi:predicted amidohydrolase
MSQTWPLLHRNGFKTARPKGTITMSLSRQSLLHVVVISLGLASPVTLAVTARGEQPSTSEHRTPKSRADRPPRKVLVGTVIFGPYGKYPGLEERLKVLSGLVDSMAEEAARAYPGRGLDLAVLPETTVTSTHGTASERAIPLQGPVLETFGALARRHKTYLVVPLDIVEESSSSGTIYSNAAVLLDRRGTVAGTYRKVHPVAYLHHDDLESGITPGREFPVFDCDFGKLGIQICWDVVFDDGWQALADKGAEIVVWPSASPASARPASKAGQHRYFVVSSCWRNNSTIYEPTGIVAARTESPGKPLVHEIDLSYALLGWSAPLREGQAFREKYGERAGFHYEPREDLGMFWSNDPKTTIGEMVRTLRLEEIDPQIARNRVLQDNARGGPAR